MQMLARAKDAMAATAMRTAVQVPYTETAFNPIEVLNRPESEVNIQSNIPTR